ncbi:MAG TPA: selenide, water dikinase SelD [Pyrinomonadaceae bacterium]|nr:selenide, water dikinase SelD [Pyrinomonadaceae bacterium]HRA40278.1 selenide, water dikinase SelD [Pyrinomonadaceae bacterium]
MAKLAPSDLAQVLSKLPRQSSENVIVGFDKSDDAGVFRLTDDTALVQTVDFFTPVADDPFTYGRVAAVNALNDVYAMGGTPLSALSIVCFPQKGDWDILAEILKGGQAAMNAEGVVVIGGHSVDDQEMKFGYAVTGVIHPDRVFTNSGARPGDVLILTKPIGTGAINTAVKRGEASESTIAAAINAMTTSAAAASKLMREVGANACTDVTGFGLLGHAYEMAKGSEVTLNIDSESVPLLPDVLELISRGMLTRGDTNNRVYVGETVVFYDSVSSGMQSALFDPQTAGGLLISMGSTNASDFVRQMPDSRVIGSVSAYSGMYLEVT